MNTGFEHKQRELQNEKLPSDKIIHILKSFILNPVKTVADSQ